MRPNVATYRTVENNLPGLHSQNQLYQQQQHQHRPHPQQQKQPPHHPGWSNHHGPSFNGSYSCVPPNQVLPPTAPIHNNCLQTYSHNLPLSTHHHRNPNSNVYSHVRDPTHSKTYVIPRNATGNYTKLSADALNLQRINDCAGIPLISTASAHLSAGQRQRAQRKYSSSPPESQKTTAAAYNWHMQHYGRSNGMPQLAAHAQGLPLLVHKSSSIGAHWSLPSSSSFKPTSRTLPTHSLCPNFSNSNNTYQLDNGYTPSALHQPPCQDGNTSKENSIMQRDSVTPSIQLAAGTSRDLTEACLPRIIKPRKRRKKDRKPTNGVFLRLDEASNASHGVDSVRSSNHEQFNQVAETQFNATNSLNVKEINNNNNFETNCGIRDTTTANPLYVDKMLIPTSYTKKLQQVETDHNPHCVCFCQNCDPLRRIWDYPLRRSFSDSSATSGSDQSSTSSSSSASSTSSRSSAMSVPTQRSRADIVGVIGSNRVNNDVINSAAATAAPSHNPLTATKSSSGCQSDSNDSGFGDILGGITLAEDIFSTSFIETQRSGALLTTHINPRSPSLLQPETAESLLNESINEISRKLLETCSGAGSCGTNDFPDVSETQSCTFSQDSGIVSGANVNSDELVFNFDQLSISKLVTNNNNNMTPNFNAHQTHFLFPPTNELLQLDLNDDDEQGLTEKCQNQQYYSNCFDLVWHNINAPAPSCGLKHEEVRPTATSQSQLVVTSAAGKLEDMLMMSAAEAYSA